MTHCPKHVMTPKQWDDFRWEITIALAITGYSAVMATEDHARAMAKLGSTPEERANGERRLSIIQECLDQRDGLQ